MSLAKKTNQMFWLVYYQNKNSMECDLCQFQMCDACEKVPFLQATVHYYLRNIIRSVHCFWDVLFAIIAAKEKY